ncbi:hypothetical protein BDR07DRAFT_1399357 [Suillus spraguei]|nr:hypothetical protein BDR07DRAFT_1399357 [Suillus spraguei]
MAPELATPILSCLDVDATNAQSGGDVFTDGEKDDPYGGYFQNYEPYYTSAPSAGPSRSRNCSPSSAWRFWNIADYSRRNSPANESTALQQRTKHGLFMRIYVTRPLVKTNAQTGQSSLATAQAVVQPISTPRPQILTRVQTKTQQPASEKVCGCWANFCLSLWCIRRRTRAVVPAA